VQASEKVDFSTFVANAGFVRLADIKHARLTKTSLGAFARHAVASKSVSPKAATPSARAGGK
jgi:hypothetical protein